MSAARHFFDLSLTHRGTPDTQPNVLPRSPASFWKRIDSHTDDRLLGQIGTAREDNLRGLHREPSAFPGFRRYTPPLVVEFP